MKKIIAIGIAAGIFTAVLSANPLMDGDLDNKLSKIDRLVASEIIIEEEIELEGWMMDVGFDITSQDEEEKLEDWMLDPDAFTVEESQTTGNNQSGVEDWMINGALDNQTSEQELVLENWMFIFS